MTKGERQTPINTPDARDSCAGEQEERAEEEKGTNGPGKGDAGDTKRGTASLDADAVAVQSDLLAGGREALVAEYDALLAERDALVAERDSLLDSLLRLKAEFENYRKRVLRDLAQTEAKGRLEVLAEFLPVLDNLERALDAAEHHEEGKVLEGVRLIRNMFVDLLNRYGIEEVAGVGTKFDPQVHEAITMQPCELEEGTVTAVLERGYKQGNKLLRPARVVVSSGPEESQKEQEAVGE